MPNTTKYPLLRRSLVVFAFLGLVGLFFALNLFLYIPRQQQSYNKKVFRILNEMTQDFDKTIEGSVTTKLKNLNKDKVDGILGNLTLSESDTTDSQLHQKLMASFDTLNATKDNSKHYRRIYRFVRDAILVDFIDTTATNVDTVHETLSIDSLLYPNIQNLHSNLFHLVMLVKRASLLPQQNEKQTGDAVLYKHGKLAVSYEFNSDSLFKNKHYGQFSTINDLNIEGAGYKAYALPFQICGTELMLIGFLPQGAYHSETTRYSKPALLWIGAFLILILLSLPVIKLLMSGRKERISINETRMLIVVFVTMPFLIILIAGAVMMYKYADAIYSKTLAEMHSDVQGQFAHEVATAIKQLKAYDSITIGYRTRCVLLLNAKKPMFEKEVHDEKDRIYYPGIYRNVDDIYWTDENGQQIAKWFFLRQPTTYLDVSKREFFKQMRDNTAFRRKNGAAWDAFFVEPTISWATGEYGINIVTESKAFFYEHAQHKALLIGMASRMYSACNPVVPEGYNFCIVNKKGTILFHSETKRSLHENLLEESNYNTELHGALAGKDSVEINDLRLFDRDVKMVVNPVADMPGYYIASYYNKRAQNLFVFHCAAFAFLCVSGMLLALLLFHLFKSLILRNGQAHEVFRYETEWMRPSELKKSFYNQVLKQQSAIALLLVSAYTLCSLLRWQPQNFLIHACVFLPFLVTINYFLVKRRLTYADAGKDEKIQSDLKRQTRKLLIFYAVIMLVLWLSLLQLLHAAIIVKAADIVILIIAVAVPLLAYCNLSLAGKLPLLRKGNYLAKYLASLLSCIALIAVLPTIGFMSYALQQEKIIKTKSEQIAAAKQIEQRRLQLNEALKKTKLHHDEQAYIKNRKLSAQYGIYLPNQELRDTMLQEPLTTLHSNDLIANVNFYKAATRFLFLPRDHADFFENSDYYQWRRTSNKASSPGIQLLYVNQNDRLTPESVYLLAKRNTGPGAFQPFFDLSTWLLILGVILFFVLHYLLLQSITKKIFLLGYITKKSEEQQNKQWPDTYYQYLQFDKQEMDLYKRGKAPLITQTVIAEIEQAIKQDKSKEDNTSLLHLQLKLTPAYHNIWNTLSDEQKYVLYDFATDGFTNYRNLDVVYLLFLKGLIIRRTDGHLEIMSYSFRNYLLSKAASEEIIRLQQKNASASIWKSTRNILYALFFAIMIFLFATQQDVSNKIIAIISGLATVVPLLIRLFDRNVAGTASKS